MNQTNLHAEIAALRKRLDELERQASAPAETPVDEMRRRYAVLEASVVALPLKTRNDSFAAWDARGDDVIRACGDHTTRAEDANLAALIALVLNRLPQMIKVIDRMREVAERGDATPAERAALAELEAPL
jgi:hypothetical protein